MYKLKESTVKGKGGITTMKRHLFSRRFSFVLLGVFLFSFASIAQLTTINVGGRNRQMMIYATPSGNANRPLVIWMHGIGGTYSDMGRHTQFVTVGREMDFHAVAPGAIDGRWDLSGNVDTDFILGTINEMSRLYNIDRNRVYLSGFSMGGMMTYHAATRIADRIAAFAPVGGYLMSGPNTNSSRPIPLLHAHGERDDYVHYNQVQRHVDAWRTRNGCPSTNTFTKPYPSNIPSSQSSMRSWKPCSNNVEVAFLSIAGVGHNWSDNANGVNTSREVWKFCSRFSLNSVPPEQTYTIFRNRATGLQIDGMSRTTEGANAGQYASTGSAAQQWVVEPVGSYVKLKNRATGLYLDGMGRTTNESACGQWTSSTSSNQQWTIETAGSYVKIRNRATGLYVDGMGSTANGADLGQWTSSASSNQQWTTTTVSGAARMQSSETAKQTVPDEETSVDVYPNPAANVITITLSNFYKNGNKTVNLVDINGKTVVSEKFSGAMHTLNIGSLPPGMYLLQVKTNKKLIVKKVIRK